MVEINIQGETYLIDFNTKKLLGSNGEELGHGEALSYLRQYLIQENIPNPKGHNNHSLISAIKRHINNISDSYQFDESKFMGNMAKKTEKKVLNIGKVVISNGKVDIENFVGHSKNNKTDISSFIKHVEHLVENSFVHKIDWSILTPKNIYNEFIRKNVSQKPGVYIWYDSKNQDVLYIGMAGKIKTNGELTNHPISKRLQAPRIKDFETKKDITTNRYIPAVLQLFGLEEIEFHILPCKENEPAAYVESTLLYNYFKAHGVLPILNNAF
jgi:hypothetical protein